MRDDHLGRAPGTSSMSASLDCLTDPSSSPPLVLQQAAGRPCTAEHGGARACLRRCLREARTPSVLRSPSAALVLLRAMCCHAVDVTAGVEALGYGHAQQARSSRLPIAQHDRPRCVSWALRTRSRPRHGRARRHKHPNTRAPGWHEFFAVTPRGDTTHVQSVSPKRPRGIQKIRGAEEVRTIHRQGRSADVRHAAEEPIERPRPASRIRTQKVGNLIDLRADSPPRESRRRSARRLPQPPARREQPPRNKE